MIAEVERNLDAIRALCREYAVVRLELFGSAASGAFDPKRSDVDFIIEYPPDYDMGPWLTRHVKLEERLEDLLGRPVDLVMAGSPAMSKKWFRREADRTRMVIYDAPEVAQLA